MPVLVDRRRVAFIVDQLPMIVLRGLPEPVGLPVLQVDEAGQIGPCSGWVLVARSTVCVVDGPGDAGLLLPVFAGDETAEEIAYFEGWLASVAAYGGAVVVAGEEEITSLADIPHRSGLVGGFVPAT